MSARPQPTSQEAPVLDSIKFLNALLHDYPKRDFDVRLWDGTLWGRVQSPRFTLVLNHSGALRNMFVDPSELTLGEAFVRGDFDVEGDLESAFALGEYFLSRSFSLTEKLWLRTRLMGRAGAKSLFGSKTANSGPRHSKERDLVSVRFHYDVSNEFYKLWLDQAMIYSCAYFRSPGDELDIAQRQKLDLICKKLRLQRGDRLLDIGCGWGGLLIHAASHYGVHAFGITLSVPQAELARERIRIAGLAERCKVEVCDYRDVDPPQAFDKIASVGMSEHVGEEMLPLYFERVWSLLRPGGVFLNHAIAASATIRRKGPSFIDCYVFPDGDVPPLNSTLSVAERCGFEVRDVENLREHYAHTLQCWGRALERQSQQAIRFVGKEIFRVWKLYMAGSAHAFKIGRLNVFQTLLLKSLQGENTLPLTREDWYCDAVAKDVSSRG